MTKKTYTLSIIKPDGVRRNLQGRILSMIQDAGLEIIAQKHMQFTLEQAQEFYKVHSARPFYGDLCRNMSNGAVSVQILHGNDAVKKYRDLMGATNPAEATDGTIRKAFGISLDENTVHGSDSDENAEIEAHLLFKKEEIIIA